MNLNDIKSLLPDYAKDLRLNLDSVLSESGAPGLVQKQIAIIALASAMIAICFWVRPGAPVTDSTESRFRRRSFA